jgi:hypothetical protein
MKIEKTLRVISGILALGLILWYLIAGMYEGFTGEIELGESVSQNKPIFNMGIGLVDLETNEGEILLYDQNLTNLYVYDSSGKLIKVYNFPTMSKIDLISYESNGDLVVFQYKKNDTYNVISNDGIVVESHEGDMPREGEYLEIVKCMNYSGQNICVENNLFYYDLVVNNESHYVSMFFPPVLLFGILLYVLANRIILVKVYKKQELRENSL